MWRARNYGKYFGSRNIELKNAIVQAFKEDYKILLVTDSGSEGLNLQFCNTIINYDLPWNPQKIEKEAELMKSKFQEELMIKPVLFTKVVIKF